MAWPACKMLLDLGDPGSFPPESRVAVVALASELPPIADCPVTRWSLDELAARLVNQVAAEALSRSTIWRILNAADLKPHRSVYWLNSHDPDFAERAREICGQYVRAPRLYEHGELTICTDEKTGMQILQRIHPTQPARPGHPEKQENDYLRHGTRALIASFVVATGEVVADLGLTRTSADFAAHLLHVANHFTGWQRITWVLDNLNTHWSLEVCEVLAMLNDVPFDPRSLQTGSQRRAFLTDPEHAYRFLYTPKHGSWLNQVELWFSVLARQFLKRGNFASPAEFEERLHRYLDHYNIHHAHPYRWTYTGEPLVRSTPFSQTRRQQRHGRAWCGQRPALWSRLFYPPRPYKRSAA